MQHDYRLPIAACALLAIASSPLHAQPPAPIDPLTIMSAADSAAHTIHSASYTGRYAYKGSGGNDSNVIEGTVVSVVDPLDKSLGAKTRIELKKSNAIYTYQRNQVQLLIPEKKQLVTADSTQGAIYFITGNMSGDIMTRFPLGDDSTLAYAAARATRLEYLGITMIEEVPCHTVKGYFPDNEYTKQFTNTWFIGQKDHILRGNFMAYLFNEALQTQNFSLGSLRTNIDVPAGMFTQSTPEGYTLEPYYREKTPELLAVGSIAPDWTLNDERGNPVTLSKLRGKVVFIDFWYTTCGPCSAAMPTIQGLHDRFKDRGLSVIGVDVHEPAEKAAAVMKRRGFTYGLVFQGDSVATRYNVSGYPTFYVIGVDGTIIYREAGYNKERKDEIGELIEGYLKEHGM